MGDSIEHNCSVVVARTLHDTYNFLKTLEHRGPECFGMFAVGDSIDGVKAVGKIKNYTLDFFEDLFPTSKYHTFVGHSRYATKGKGDVLSGCHPFFVSGTSIDSGSHIIVREAQAALVHNGQIDEKYLDYEGSESQKFSSDSHMALHYLTSGGINEIGFLRNVPGAYTLAFADTKTKKVMVLRDGYGVKPAVIGTKDGKTVMTSEDVAIIANGGEYVEDMAPGSVYYFNSDGTAHSQRVVKRNNFSHCFFESNYIQSPRSAHEGVLTRTIRAKLGEQLAREHPIPEATFVTYIPRSPRFAAIKYASSLGIPFEKVLIKRRDARSFQERSRSERNKSIDENLYVRDDKRHLIEGADIVVVDDSTVRGTNCRKARDLLLEAGAAKLHLVNYTSEIGVVKEDGTLSGCSWGVDTPPDGEFIVRKIVRRGSQTVVKNRTLEEISKELEMDVRFLSMKGMLSIFDRYGLDPKDLCTACVGGKHPFEKD